MNPVRLRAHHFLCTLTYGGAGYTPEFTCNMDAVVARMGSGECEIELVAGPDDICAPMMQCREHPEFHCLEGRIDGRDAAALEGVNSVLASMAGENGLPGSLAVGGRLILTPRLVERLRAEFARGTIRAACHHCEWHPRCTERAAGGYQGARLMAGDEA